MKRHTSLIDRPMFRAASLVLWLSIGMVGCQPIGPSPEWLGINTHWSARTLEAQNGGEADLDDELELLKDLHIRHVRAPLMDWAAIESLSDAGPDWSATDRIVLKAQRMGVKLVAVCPGVPPWAQTAEGLPDPDRIEQFADFVRRFVERYDGDGRRDMPGLQRPIEHFELAFDLSRVEPDAYAAWVSAFADAVKTAAPRATVILGGLTNPGLDPCDPNGRRRPDDFARLLDAMALDHGNAMPFDVVGFSCFPLQCLPVPDPFNTATGYLRKAMADRSFVRPLWMTAYGQNVNQSHPDRQAADLVKWTLTARTLDVDRMFLHALTDVEPPGRPRGAFGLAYRVMNDHTAIRRKAFEAVAVLAERLSKQSIVTYRLPGLYMLTSREEPTYVLWRPDIHEPPHFELNGWWEVTGLDGRSSVILGLNIQSEPEPIYLRQSKSPF